MKMLDAGLLIVFVTFPLHLAATSVVVIATKNGIAISSDSLTGLAKGDHEVYGTIQQKKYAILQDRIVVAIVGYGAFKDDKHDFAFLNWVERVRSSLPPNASVDDVAAKIETESAVEFSTLDINSYLKSGQLTRNDRNDPCTILTQFVIVGYQDGSPRIYTVQFDVDWNHKTLLGPFRKLNPDSSLHGLISVAYGFGEATKDFMNPRSYAHQIAVELCPEVMKKLDTRSQVPSVDEIVVLSRALVQVEENTNPNSVGGPIKTVRILPNGHAEEALDKGSKE